jgi:peptidoglycan/xylan/chitin deacetylase (PgdA/CDA1 family)
MTTGVGTPSRFAPAGLPRAAIRKAGAILTQAIPVSLWSQFLPQPVVCPCYHMVSDTPVPHVKHYPFLKCTEFERDLSDLETRFPYATYGQILTGTSGLAPDRATSVCLTFDDGFAECASVVRPILLRRNATCIFFIVTDLIGNKAVFSETKASLCAEAALGLSAGEIDAIVDALGLRSRLMTAERLARVPVQMGKHWLSVPKPAQPLFIWLMTAQAEDTARLDELCRLLSVDAEAYVRRVKPYLTAEQILELRADGFTIGAHGRSHRRLQEMSRTEAEEEIVESCWIIQNLTGEASVPFAFPYFGWGLDRSWLEDLRRRHPFIGLFFDTGGFRRDVPFVIQRMFGERMETIGPMDRLLQRAWVRRLT